MKHSVLCIDDEKDNVEALERLLRKTYKVFTAISGIEALKILNKHEVSLIISDQKMPQMTGVEFFKKSIHLQPDCIRILLTGYTDLDSVVSSINTGEIYKYLTKPWDPVDLVNTVHKGIEKFELRTEIKKQNIELEKLNKELLELDQAKTHFMILMNHELKTPLTVIISYLSLLTELDLDNEAQNYTKKIKSATQRLQKMIDDILLLISAQTKQLKINKKSFNLADFMKSTLEQFNVEQKVNVKTSLKNINSDAEVIKNVLTRILDNAIRHGDQKSDIECYITEQNNAIHFSVVNQGKVISEKMIKNILKPFTLDEEIMNHSKGLGLGLSLSQALVSCLDSHLEISSNKKSTSVSFSLQQ